MKNVLMACLVLCSLGSCKKDMPEEKKAATSENVSKKIAARLAPTEKIKLVKAGTVAAYISRSYLREKTFYAEVANLAYSKQVFAHHKMSDGTWKDFPLSYRGPADNGSELWAWELNYGNGTAASQQFATVGFGDEFVLGYTVNGQTYWDNNNGKNYNISNYVNTDGLFLQNGLNISADTYRSYLLVSPAPANHFVQVYADVRNIAYKKQVTMVYTTDGWATVKYASLGYANTYAYGGDNYFLNSSLKNFEKWATSFYVPQGSTNLQYALSYRVNGVEYWDNNYGKNYTITVKTQ